MPRRTPLEHHALSAMIVVMVVMIMVMIVVVIMVIIVPVLVLIVAHLMLLTTHFVLVLFMRAHLVAEVLFALALTELLARRVYVVIPALRHEVDRPSARVVLAAVPRPMSLVTGRYV